MFTKAQIYAVDRINAIKKVVFTKTEDLLIGETGYAYDGYWVFSVSWKPLKSRLYWFLLRDFHFIIERGRKLSLLSPS